VIGLAVLNFRFQGIVGLGGKSPVQLDTEENRCGPEAQWSGRVAFLALQVGFGRIGPDTGNFRCVNRPHPCLITAGVDIGNFKALC
ncbi:hypothetical protein ID855_18230, partial [Xenorhabdus sp. ZM]|nr:hypothetical protein [Xenorhabdus sp. ZM]